MNFVGAGPDVDSLAPAFVTVGVGFPPVRLAVQLTRSRWSQIDYRWHTETGYAVTELRRPDRLGRRRRPRTVALENRL